MPESAERRASRKRNPNLKITPDCWQVDIVMKALTEGQWRSVAEHLVGLPIDTISEWVAKGTKPGAKEPWRTLATRVLAAEAQAEANAVRDLLAMGREKDYKAILEWLKRRAKDRWGDQPIQVEITHDHAIIDAILEDKEVAERVADRFRKAREKREAENGAV